MPREKKSKKLLPTPQASDHITKKTSKRWKEKGAVNFTLSNPEIQKLWPTPRAGNPGSRKPGTGGKVLGEEVKLFPTPTSGRADQGLSPSQFKRHSFNLAQTIEAQQGLYPTPTQQDSRIGSGNIGGSQHRAERGLKALADVILFPASDSRKKMWTSPTAADAFTDKLRSGQQKPGSKHSVNLSQEVQMDFPEGHEQSTQLPLLLADSLASLLVLPGDERARQTTVGSGRRCLESYQRSGPLGSLQRMLLDSLEWSSTIVLLSWKAKNILKRRWQRVCLMWGSFENEQEKEVWMRYWKVLSQSDIPSSRLLFQLAPSTPPTDEIESSLWLTPATVNIEGGENRVEERTAYRESIGRHYAPGCLAEQVMWATPSVADTRMDIRKPEERSDKANKGGCANLREQVMLPTPSAQRSGTGGVAGRTPNEGGGIAETGGEALRSGEKVPQSGDIGQGSEALADTLLRAERASHRKGSNRGRANSQQDDRHSLGNDIGNRDEALPDAEEQSQREPTNQKNTISGSGKPWQESSGGDWWAVEPELGRVAYGIPSRVDRLKCLGNAVVPQQVYPILKAIAEIERASWIG